MYQVSIFNRNRDKGLTLVEVLIATLIVIVFITVSLQALTVAALFKSRGKIQIDAINWIQKDLEDVRRVASTVSDATRCKAATSTNGYGKLLETSLTGSTIQGKSIAGINYEKHRTITVSGGAASGGSCKLNACYESLLINYKVKGTGGQSSVILADVQTEVIPDAVFQCPL